MRIAAWYPVFHWLTSCQPTLTLIGVGVGAGGGWAGSAGGSTGCPFDPVVSDASTVPAPPPLPLLQDASRRITQSRTRRQTTERRDTLTTPDPDESFADGLRARRFAKSLAAGVFGYRMRRADEAPI
jgi:hypothetical protein